MRAFLKFQTSSVLSTLLDYSITIFLTEVLSVLYTLSSACGLLSGGIINFLLNKNWVFEYRGKQEFRLLRLYVAVWATNLFMNTIGLYMLTEMVRMDYRISKILTSVVVGVLLSYFAQRRIVFRPQQRIV
ncbi:MAG: GtrA family protein [Bacteroidetes bacterium]|nr:GtrA family protein [Bacteroidota bacterium]